MSEPRPNETASNDDDLLEELSAFMDGELDADRARFLMQRLSHDAELRTRWERWQLQSSTIRRQAQPVPAGFADRVSRAIDATVAPIASRRSRGLRWAGGAALAASLVIASTFVFDATHTPPVAAPKVAMTATPILPIQRTVLPLPEPAIKLPIPVQSGVVTAFHSRLHPVLLREPQQRPNFAPFPQPYAIDPELEAYLHSQKSGTTHDVFAEDATNNGAVRTVAFPLNQQP
ncbi:MAG TPA: RseA family anti-sigma factor [Xanthomonadaceae bacterium]|jgi:negative regulator of sigma E activity|nr:RseA family anti-sigma factor [Xanthomonadaceae bacterium]